MKKQVSLVLLGFRLNASVLSSEGRETRPFDFYELKIVVYGTEISWSVPLYLGLRRQIPAGGRGATIASKFLPIPCASHLVQNLNARHILPGLVDVATPPWGLRRRGTLPITAIT